VLKLSEGEAVCQSIPLSDKFTAGLRTEDLYQQLSRRKMGHKFWLAQSSTKEKKKGFSQIKSQ
jgi:hypothetical protein